MAKCRRFLFLLLALVLAAGSIPLTAAQASVVTVSDTGTITRAQWLQQLVTTFGYSVGDEIVPDNYYTDLSPEADYYEDVLTAVYYGLADVLPNQELRPDDPATREFAAHTLNSCMGYLPEQAYAFRESDAVTYPDDIQVAVERGWFALSGDAFLPEQPITLAEQEMMLADAKAYVSEFTIDGSQESVYTFKDGIIEITDPVTIVPADEGALVTITGPTQTIAPGDRFVVYHGGLAIPYQADSVEQGPGQTVVTATELDFADAIETMEVRTATGTDPANFYAAEDAELIFIEESTGAELSQQAAVKAKLSGSTSVYVPKYIKTIELADGIKVKLEVELKGAKVCYDVKLSAAKANASVWLDTDAELSGKVSCELPKLAGDGLELYIGGYSIPGVGGLEFKVKFDATGSISVVKRFHMQIGLKVGYNAATRETTRNRIFSLTDRGSCVNSEISAKVCLTAKFGLYGKAMPLKGYVYAEAGFEAKVKYTTYSEIPGACTDFAAHLYAEYGAKVEWNLLGIKNSLDWKQKPIDENSSPVKLCFHYEDGVMVGECTRKSWIGTTTGDPSAIVESGYLTGYDSSYFGSGLSSGFGSKGYGPGGEPIVIYTYELDENNKATITGYKGNAISLTIPQKLDGYDVTAIGSSAFTGNKRLRTVIMQDNILTIGHSAFRKCENLRNVVFSEGLTLIDENAFRECKSLVQLNLPDSLLQINGGAFADCTSLQYLKLPEKLEAVYYGAFSGTNGAFQYCTSLTEVRLPDSLKILGCGTFRGCTALKKVYIPKETMPQEHTSGNHMYPGPFSGCSSLTEVEFETGIERIPFGLFYGCNGLIEFRVPDTVTEIQYNAFLQCPSLEKVILPDGLISIGNSAFSGCTALTEITLPNTLEALHNNAFGGCTALTSINIPKGMDTEAYTGHNNQHAGPFSGCSSLTELEFEEGITRIPQGLFFGCNGLKELVLPETVTSIEFRAFRYCTSLETIRFPENLQVIHQGAFRNCTALKEVTLPDNLLELDLCAFGECESLTKVHIPKSFVVNEEFVDLGNWNTGVFGHCPSLTEVTFAQGITSIPNDLFLNCNGLKEITLPDTVTEIRERAFQNCTALETLKLPASLEIIGNQAFRNCPLIPELILPTSMQEIGYGAFWDCHGITKVFIPKGMDTKLFCSGDTYFEAPFHWCAGLTDVTFEEGITRIPDGLFAHCRVLTQIDIPDTVTELGNYAFRGCILLEELPLPEQLTAVGEGAFSECVLLKEMTIPATVSQMGSGVFKGCTGLETVAVLGPVTELPNETFHGCTCLRTVELPDTITRLGENAFTDCTSLPAFQIPGAVTRIEGGCFRNCDALTEITIPDQVINLAYSVFYDCDALETVNMADSVRAMGNYVFYHCDALKNVKLSSNLTAISRNAFEQCAVMEEIRIPMQVTKIDSMAFSSCPMLKKVVLPRIVSNIYSNAFSYPGSTVIHGVAGTYAETWAAENDFQFVPYSNPVTGISLPAELKLNTGAREYLLLTVEPFDCTDIISWKVSDPYVVQISDNGLVTALRPGTATIKVTVGSQSATCTVTVGQGIASVWINCTTLTLDPQETFKLTGCVQPEDAENRNVLWSSSDPAVATVADNGVVTAISKGTAIITAYAEADPDIMATCTVTVKAGGIVVTDPTQLESPHNYPDSCEDYWIYTSEGAQTLRVTFDERTMLENGFDYLYISRKENGEHYLIGQYTGAELAGATIEVPGDTVILHLISDDSGNDWGFRVTEVVPVVPHVHDYEVVVTDPTCTEGGYTTHTCECGDSYTDGETEALGHDYEAGVCKRCGGEDPDYEEPVDNPFTDVPEGQWFSEPVLWAVEKGITTGTSATTFGPNAPCTRAQVVTFLWRAMGQPEPEKTDNPFTDVPEGVYYYEAVLWAVEKGVTSGMNATTFGPNVTCTRAQVVTFLWRAMDKVNPQSSRNPFLDVAEGEYFHIPVLWAVENGITSGTSETTFAPNHPCTRGQVVTFLYRAMKEK